MFLTVYLSNNEQHFTEVPVTAETVCRDVVDLCKEPGESDCHLAEVWAGSGMRSSSHELLSVCLFPFLVFGHAACDVRAYPRRKLDQHVCQQSVFLIQLRCDIASLSVTRGRCHIGKVKGQAADRPVEASGVLR